MDELLYERIKRYQNGQMPESERLAFENQLETEAYTQLYAKIKQLKNAEQVSKIDAPAELQNILRSYQTEGFQWLCHLHHIGWGGILADDMGLGKTIQTLSFLLYLKQTQQTIKILIISPTTLLYNWENEIKKFISRFKEEKK